ncbi:MAG: hypothetical protein ABFD91_16305 [Anaerohalosphaeraceae bacterium]|mgnify:CR=1 FL=1
MTERNRYGLNKHGRVDWRNTCNKKCLDLLAWGFSISCIERETGLTPGKIMYRARARKIKISEFRNGVGPKAVVLLSRFKIKKQGA